MRFSQCEFARNLKIVLYLYYLQIPHFLDVSCIRKFRFLSSETEQCKHMALATSERDGITCYFRRLSLTHHTGQKLIVKCASGFPLLTSPIANSLAHFSIFWLSTLYGQFVIQTAKFLKLINYLHLTMLVYFYYKILLHVASAFFFEIRIGAKKKCIQ